MERLKQLRLGAGLTQQALAELLGVERSTYVKYERGNSDPPTTTLIRLSDFFGVPVDFIIGHDGPNIVRASNSAPSFSVEAQKIAAAFDKATAKEKCIVELILSEYLDGKQGAVRVAALSNGGEVDLSGANPDAPLSSGFKSGPDIP